METAGPSTPRESSFGALLRRHRLAAGLTQEALAERAGISERSIRDFERGVARRPHRETVDLLVEALGLASARRAAFNDAASASSIAIAAGSRTRANSSTALVGRAPELALIDRHLASGDPPVLVLAGEPGIGKSHLLAEAGRRGRAQGWRVLQGGCQRQGGQAVFSPVLEALERCIGEQRPADLRRSLRGCAWLVRLLPELTDGPIEPLPAWTLPTDQERRLVFGSVARFLANVAGPAGTLLVLDDLQWAGPDALDLLGALIRAAPPRSLCVVGAYRDTEVGPGAPLEVFLADLIHAGQARRSLLRPLDPADAEYLLDLLLDGLPPERHALRRQLLERANGVPFFLRSCALALQSGEDAPAGVPWDVAHSVRQRLAALPQTAREILGIAAVIGRQVPSILLAQVVRLPEREAFAALHAARQARLLDEAGDGHYRFAHDVIREVVEADLGTAWRSAIHRRIAEALERAGRGGAPPLEALVYHHSRGGTWDQAALYLEQAGDGAAAQSAYAAARGHYQELLLVMDRLGRTHESAGVRLKLGVLLGTIAQFNAALGMLEGALDLYQRAGDRENWVRALAEIARVYAGHGDSALGLTRLEPLLESLRPLPPSVALAQYFAVLSRLYFHTARYDELLHAARRGADLARAIGDDHSLVVAEIGRACAYKYTGQMTAALRVLETILPLAPLIYDPSPLAVILLMLGNVRIEQGAFVEAGHYLERAVEVAERSSNMADLMGMVSRLGLLAWYCGDSARADELLQQALTLHRTVGQTFRSASVFRALAEICLAQGAWAEADQHLGVATLIATSTGSPEDGTLAEDLRAQLEIASGAVVAALQRPASPLTLAWAEVEAGRAYQAEARLAPLLAQARSEGLKRVLVEALWIQASAAIRQGRWSAADQALREALPLARNMPYPLAEGRLLCAAGHMHAQRGEPDAAREQLDAALAIFHRLGAQADRERARLLLTLT